MAVLNLLNIVHKPNLSVFGQYNVRVVYHTTKMYYQKSGTKNLKNKEKNA